MIYIKKYETQAEYDAELASGLTLPNVSAVVENRNVFYNPYVEPSHDYSKDYFTIVPLENGTISFSTSGLQYSTDNTAWTSWDGSSLSVTSGTKLYLKGTMTPVEDEGIGFFSSTNNFSVEGNVMSLLYGDNFIGQTSINGYSYAFYNLLSYCEYLISAENLILPATTLANYCYYGMFRGCTSLTTAPELPATTLVNRCYQYMFQGCTGLTTAPVLPATTLAELCYYYMFEGCTSLNYIKCLATDKSASSCTYYWVSGVAATGTFVKNPSMSSWGTGNNGIPTGWTVQDAT